MRGLGINHYDANEFVRIPIYFPNTTIIVLIIREIYIVDNLNAKTFIDIDIIKSEDLIFDFRRNVIIVDSCQQLKISIVIHIKKFRQIQSFLSKFVK